MITILRYGAGVNSTAMLLLWLGEAKPLDYVVFSDTGGERPETLAWDRVQVVHGRVQDLTPIPGSFVLLDPPYLGAPRYAVLFPRAEVLRVALSWAEVAERVLVCEGQALPLKGWTSWPIAAREWVTSYERGQHGQDQILLFRRAG